MADAHRTILSFTPQASSDATSLDLRSLPFLQAASAWLASREPYISPKTLREFKLNIKTLDRFFGRLCLTQITANQIRDYQRMRMGSCGASAINHECSALLQMLKRIGHWAEIAGQYQPLPLPKEMRGRALEDAEHNRLFGIAASNPNWEAAYLFATISVNTTCGPKEIFTLRLRDVNLEQRTIRVQPAGAKNAHRIRVIPLNDDGFGAVVSAMQRAQKLGASEPDHYLFPFRICRNNYDPARHQRSFKTAWRELRAAADLPKLRMYDLRHDAITRLLENPEVSEETAEAIAGHISHAMKKRYSHIRIEVKRAALSGLSAVPKQAIDRATISTQDVLDMLNAGLDASIVVAKINQSKGQFDTSPNALKQLRATGVPNPVIVAMVKAS